ncbi:unnamed protein product, partial [Ectocarpus fasciculatus]
AFLKSSTGGGGEPRHKGGETYHKTRQKNTTRRVFIYLRKVQKYLYFCLQVTTKEKKRKERGGVPAASTSSRRRGKRRPLEGLQEGLLGVDADVPQAVRSDHEAVRRDGTRRRRRRRRRRRSRRRGIPPAAAGSGSPIDPWRTAAAF